MELPPFLLDHWLAHYEFAETPIAHNLASSTGPRWTWGELHAFGRDGTDLADTALGYAPPQGGEPLRQAIAGFLGSSPERVVVTTGASEALSALLCVLARPGGNVVAADPAFPAYDAMCRAWGLGTRHYRLSEAEGFVHDASAILASVDASTVAVLVNTPHNPTGVVMRRSELEVLARGLQARSIPLIVDEVYHPLYFGEPQETATDLENTIVVGDLSKALSLPGLRTGWIVDPDASRRERLIDARSYFTISGSPVLEAAAALALRNWRSVIGRVRPVATANLGSLEALIGSSPLLSWVKPQGGTTAFPWFEDGRDSRPFCEVLATRGVLLAPGDCFGRPAHFRVGLGQDDAGFGRACDLIRAALDEQAGSP